MIVSYIATSLSSMHCLQNIFMKPLYIYSVLLPWFTFFLLFNNATFFNIQNIEDGKTYNLVMYAKSPETTDLTVSLTSADGSQSLASATVTLVIFLTFLGQEKIFVSS